MNIFPLEFETERLLLRQWRESDFDEYASMCADLEVMKYLTAGKVFDRMESWRHMAYLIGHWQLKGFGQWAVVEKHTNELLGRVGFIQPEGWPGFELGWALKRESWGKGYATEAAREALVVAFEQMDKTEVISVIHPQNDASKAVADRLGESHQYDTHLKGIKVQIWGIDRQSFLARHNLTE